MSSQITENCLKMHEKLTWDSPMVSDKQLRKTETLIRQKEQLIKIQTMILVSHSHSWSRERL